VAYYASHRKRLGFALLPESRRPGERFPDTEVAASRRAAAVLPTDSICSLYHWPPASLMEHDGDGALALFDLEPHLRNRITREAIALAQRAAVVASVVDTLERLRFPGEGALAPGVPQAGTIDLLVVDLPSPNS
jgi:hypothetical protein